MPKNWHMCQFFIDARGGGGHPSPQEPAAPRDETPPQTGGRSMVGKFGSTSAGLASAGLTGIGRRELLTYGGALGAAFLLPGRAEATEAPSKGGHLRLGLAGGSGTDSL